MGHQRTSRPHRCYWQITTGVLALAWLVFGAGMLWMYQDLKDCAKDLSFP